MLANKKATLVWLEEVRVALVTRINRAEEVVEKQRGLKKDPEAVRFLLAKNRARLIQLEKIIDTTSVAADSATFQLFPVQAFIATKLGHCD